MMIFYSDLNCCNIIRNLSEYKILYYYYYVTAITACILCICVVNLRHFDGTVLLILNVIICTSVTILLITMIMMKRLPQAIENLSFKVRNSFLLFPIRRFINNYSKYKY